MWLSDTQKIGVGLISFGLLFLSLGMILLFDAGLIAMGNILFVIGVALTIGPPKVAEFVWRPGKRRGTICFLIGFTMIFFKWTFFGLLIEMFGFINLFGDFFPYVIAFLKNLPFIGNFLNLPAVARVLDRIAGTPSPV